MALIDEYKQAIQDVLDGRAKEAPRPSELPWSEDKAATMWAAAAAELIAEAAIPEPGADLPDTPGSDGTYALQNTVSSGTGTLSWASGGGGGGSDTLFAHFTLSGESVVCDCTVSEVNEAIEAGKEVVGVFTNNRASLSGVKKYVIYGSEYILYFSFIDLYTGGSGNKLYVYNISMNAPAGTITKTVYNVALST